MAIEAKDIVVRIRKGLMYSIRISLKSACDHPFVLGTVFLLLILYRCFPSLFAFLVSSSPVIICTTLLLGILLSYGEPNLPEIEEDEKTREISSLKVGSAANDLVVEKDESYTIEAHLESREISERTVKEASVGEGRATDSFMAASSSFEEDDKEIHSEDKAIEERDVEAVCGVSTEDQKEINALKVEVDEITLENRVDSSLDSPWQPIDSHDLSPDSESDCSESSSPDASMADIIPMLDELHPLLDTGPHPALKSMDDSDAVSGGSAQDDESDDGSASEEREHQEEEEDDEEEETQEEKDDGNEEAVKWTAADQKNLMDLGTSEMERNQRLENLIAKRRARKNLRYETENNLIDLDSNDPATTIEDLSHFLAQIPPISAIRRNPFDLPFDLEETTGLPPIPGSAPSVLLPRRNPFDAPYDQVDHSDSLTVENSRHQEFVSVPHRDIFFRRHESFCLGASFSGEPKQEKYDSRFKPYFAEERAEETGFAAFQRHLSENSDSKVSYDPESGLASSVVDQENHKQLLEEGLNPEGELSPTSHDAEPVEPESQSSVEVDSVDVDHKLDGIDVGDDREIDLNTSNLAVETHHAADSSRAMEEEIIEVEYDLPISGVANLEVIEDKYGESSSNSLSESNEKSSKMSAHEESINLKPTPGDFSKVSSDSMPADSKLLGSTGEKVDDSEVEDPVYDTSPSAPGKSHYEDLFNAGKISSNSSSLADISELGSPLRPLEKNISSGDFEPVNEDLAFASGEIWVAPLSLSAVDENESRSREVTEIRERDVIQVGLSGVSEDFVKPMSLQMPRSIAGRPSSLSSVDVESVDADTSFQSDGDENSVSSGHSSSSASEKGHPSMEIAIQPSPESSLEEPPINVLKLSPVYEENLEDFNLEEEHEDPRQSDGLFVANGVDPLICPEKQDFPTQLLVSEARSMEDAVLHSGANSGNSEELHSVMNQPNGMESKSESEELDSALKQVAEEAVMHSVSEPIVDEIVAEKAEVRSSERKGDDKDPELIETDSELQGLEANSIKDINYAFEQTSKGDEVEPSKSLVGRKHMELMGTHSTLPVVEAKSLEDVNLVSAENPKKAMDTEDGLIVVEFSNRHLEPEAIELHSVEAAARESNETSQGFETMAVDSSSGGSN